jgi:hypothetical protein
VGRSNTLGYVAPFDYRPGTRMLAVLGDSYVESLMNPYEATLQAEMQKLVGDRTTVYNFGISGSALPDYLGLSDLLTDRFRVEELVIVVTEGDFVDGFMSKPGHFTWTAEEPGSPVALEPDIQRSPLSKAIRELALFRYVRGNLKMTTDTLFKSLRRGAGDAPSDCASGAPAPGDEALVRRFVRELPRAYGIAPANIVLVFDSEQSRRATYQTTARSTTTPDCTTRDARALATLADAAEEAGIQVVRLAPVFEAHFRSTGQRVDHSPDDWHWDATGHRLAASRVVQALGTGATARARPQ